jgi:hypothetical protein
MARIQTPKIQEGAATVEQQLAAVKAYAIAKYEVGGWDEVVEAWDDSDILSRIEGCKTRWGAIVRVSTVVKLRHAYAEDIRAA